jgi:hypothetical protein
MLIRFSVFILNNFTCNIYRNESTCFCCVPHAFLQHCWCFRAYKLCYFVTPAVDEHNAVSHTPVLFNMYLILPRFIANTNYWNEKSAYSTRHKISKQSAALWLIRSVAERRPQRIGFELGSVHLTFVQASGTGAWYYTSTTVSPVSTLPPVPHNYPLLCILIALKSNRLTSYFKETFWCVAVKNDSDGLAGDWVWLLAQNLPVWYTIQCNKIDDCIGRII